MRLCKNLSKLPDDIKDKILNYLYFSNKKTKKIKSVNSFITNFDMHIWNTLYQTFKNRPETLNYRVLKFICYKLNRTQIDLLEKKCNLNFDTTKSIYDNYRIIQNMDFLSVKKMYNYIMFQNHII